MSLSRPSRSPLFVVLEGIDGSGTTTQLERVVRYLAARGRTALSTREPSGGPVGKLLREILLGQHVSAGSGGSFDGRAMALLFAADRRDHLAREIEPALVAGNDVVSDRYVLSSLAYQAEEADRRWVEGLAEGIRAPDLTIILDLPMETAAHRRRLAQRPTERYDADRTQERVAENYRRLAGQGQQQGERPADAGRRWGRIVVVDAAGTIDEVERAVLAQIEQLLLSDGTASGGHAATAAVPGRPVT